MAATPSSSYLLEGKEGGEKKEALLNLSQKKHEEGRSHFHLKTQEKKKGRKGGEKIAFLVI